MKKRQTIIFMITNGAGLGHLTRGLAVAKRLKIIAPWLDIVFFTTCMATEVIRKEGFMYFYTPSMALLPEEVSATTWVSMLKDQLGQLINFYHPIGVVFEGAYPCGAIISQLRNNPSLKSVWIKRESNKSDPQCLKDLEEAFNLVIVPREAGKDYEEEIMPDNKCYCPPVILIDENQAHSREEVRSALGVKKNEKLFYIQLGTLEMNDSNGVLGRTQKCLVGKRNTKLLVAESIIGPSVETSNPNIKIIRNYPNAQYFKAIDFAITAAGYNTYHEIVHFNIPTLFIPNTQTVLDDQVKRAMYLTNRGAALCLRNMKLLDQEITQLQEKRDEIRARLALCKEENGALDAAKLIAHAMGININRGEGY